MQCPPTSPGRNFRKFHFVPAASSTSPVSMPIRWKILASSFTKAMFRSRWEFSITLAASATFKELARKVPFFRMARYSASTASAASGVEPEVIFRILVSVCSLSPGLIRSGLYPQKKSRLNARLLYFSRIGTHSSSVHPG